MLCVDGGKERGNNNKSLCRLLQVKRNIPKINSPCNLQTQQRQRIASGSQCRREIQGIFIFEGTHLYTPSLSPPQKHSQTRRDTHIPPKTHSLFKHKCVLSHGYTHPKLQRLVGFVVKIWWRQRASLLSGRLNLIKAKLCSESGSLFNFLR